MARWDNVLTEQSRLLLESAPVGGLDEQPQTTFATDHTIADDEGHDTQIKLHRRWHFPRALRWWMHRGEDIQLAG